MAEPDTAAAIAEAAAAVRRGEVIGLPTDTVYGVGADPFDESATRRLFAAKDRPDDVALPVLVGDAGDADDLAQLDDDARLLIARYWPGALTVVVPRRAGERALHLGGDDATIGLRSPAHPVAQALLRVTGPLAVTSANPHGGSPAHTADELRAALGDRVEHIVDGGRCEGRPSTVVSLVGPERAVLRVGSISPEDIVATLTTST